MRKNQENLTKTLEKHWTTFLVMVFPSENWGEWDTSFGDSLLVRRRVVVQK